MSSSSRFSWGELAIVETGTALLVAAAGDPDDWLVCFEKAPNFPAQEWAERMLHLYNATGCRPATPPSLAENPIRPVQRMRTATD